MKENFFYDNFKIEIAMLIGIFTFFLGGLINLKNDLTSIIISASIAGVIGFLGSYFILKAIINKKADKNIKDRKNNYIKNSVNKGKKIDITIDNTGNNILK